MPHFTLHSVFFRAKNTNQGSTNVALIFTNSTSIQREGAMIRSKARWCEQGERGTRYFFNLEKRNRSNNYITKLKADDRTLVTTTEILKEEHGYYQKLYTSTWTNPNDTCFDKFFESLTLPKLTAQLADTSDARLTKEERHVSSKHSPGVSLLARTA